MNQEKILSALSAIVITAIVAFATAKLSADFFEVYGSGIFLFSPFVCGLISVWIFNRKGQFILSCDEDGHVLLEGTTWFFTKMEPEFYWSWLTEKMIHMIHLRVLSHIKQSAELKADKSVFNDFLHLSK